MQVTIRYDEILPYLPGDYGQHIYEITATLHDDGRLVVDRRQPLCVLQSEANSYAHLVGKPDAPPTAAQRATVARWYLNREDRPAAPSRSLCAWAFAGINPREVGRPYGDGRRIVYLS